MGHNAHHDPHRVTATHRSEYLHAYHKVARRFGPRIPGRNIIRDGVTHGILTDKKVTDSLAVLHRMLHPVPVSTPVIPTATTPAATYASAAPSSSLEACIISHESGGNSQAVNGQYEGIGQWSPASWAEYGGTQYSATPLGASYAEQEQVLASEGTRGMEDQQGQYDGC
jgi:hypothetical protein